MSTPGDDTTGTGYLDVTVEPSPDRDQFFAASVETVGFVMNTTRLWALLPDLHGKLFGLLDDLAGVAGLTFRQRGILVTACASTLGDSYCSLAWGRKLTDRDGPEVPVSVIIGADDALTPDERALAAWARLVAGSPADTVAADVEPLRAAGYDDAQILAITAFVGLRMAFSTVNAALGVQPDHEYDDDSPVRAVVGFGRPIAAGT